MLHIIAPEYSMSIQAWIPAALCAIHNFISIHDSAEEIIYDADNDNTYNPVDHNDVAPAAAARPSARWGRIAQEMWEDYLAVCMERGTGDDEYD